MTVKDLIALQRKETEEEDKAQNEIETVKGSLDEEIDLNPDDEMFCTAAGATRINPGANHKNLLRQLFMDADRA